MDYILWDRKEWDTTEQLNNNKRGSYWITSDSRTSSPGCSKDKYRREGGILMESEKDSPGVDSFPRAAVENQHKLNCKQHRCIILTVLEVGSRKRYQGACGAGSSGRLCGKLRLSSSSFRRCWRSLPPSLKPDACYFQPASPPLLRRLWLYWAQLDHPSSSPHLQTLITPAKSLLPHKGIHV